MSASAKYIEVIVQAALRGKLEGNLLTGRFISFGRLFVIGSLLFEHGALLGQAFRDRLEVFVLPFCARTDYREAEAATDAVEFLHGEGRKLAEMATKADTIHELLRLYHSEIATAQNGFVDQGATWVQWFRSQRKRMPRLPARLAPTVATDYLLMGAGFGAMFPERFEQMYLQWYKTVEQEKEPESWRAAYNEGIVHTHKPFNTLPFDEYKQQTLDAFAAFCSEFYPDLLEPLGLVQVG